MNLPARPRPAAGQDSTSGPADAPAPSTEPGAATGPAREDPTRGDGGDGRPEVTDEDYEPL